MILSRWGNRRWVLIGVGHTHTHILRRWPKMAPPDTQLICVSDHPIATYSGMLPAVLAGQVGRSAMEIDLVRLCRVAGATLVIDSPLGIDHQRKEILFSQRAPLAFDLVSIGIGSVPHEPPGGVANRDTFVSIKPMQTFLDRLDQAIATALHANTSEQGNGIAQRPLSVAVVGGGVAGIELILALHQRFQRELKKNTLIPQLSLVDAAPSCARELPPRARKILLGELHRRRIEFRGGFRVNRISIAGLEANDGATCRADLVIWATGAMPPSGIESWGLPLDERGFIQTDPTLQVIGHRHCFAVGDTGTIQGLSVPKAGVYAVKQGPILERNLHAADGETELIAYRPQHDFLRLINLADGTALAVRSGWTARGKWAYRWKRWIDDGFMAMHDPQRLSMHHPSRRMKPLQATATVASTTSHSNAVIDSETTRLMRCRGCGSKLAASPLRSVLERLELGPELGRDDVAWIESPSKNIAWSVDFFPSPVDDPELAGRLAARHALGDLIAKGIQPQKALAIVQLPELEITAQSRILFETLSGAKQVFDRFGCRLIGGHTLSGPQLSLGFTILGGDDRTEPLTKSQIAEGDLLLITQPLGIGVALAALDRALCPARTYASMLQWINEGLQPQASQVLSETARAATDVTGFGLAGHLAEMLGDSPLTAVLTANRIPLLPGVSELIASGILSSLYPDNQRLPVLFEESRAASQDGGSMWSASALNCEFDSGGALSAAFDPQTCGGLLLAIPPKALDDAQQRFQAIGMHCWQIGHIERSIDARPRIRWVSSESTDRNRD